MSSSSSSSSSGPSLLILKIFFLMASVIFFTFASEYLFCFNFFLLIGEDPIKLNPLFKYSTRTVCNVALSPEGPEVSPLPILASESSFDDMLIFSGYKNKNPS